MGLKINGSTSGSIEIDVPAVAGTDTSITIPAKNGGTFIVEESTGNIDLGPLDINGSAADDSVNIDGSGRLLVGTSSTSSTALLQVQGNSSSSTGDAIIQLRRGENNANVLNGESLGSIQFSNSESTVSAVIEAIADANWNTTNDYPSRLVFSTTADAASSPTERMRIAQDGRVETFQNSTSFFIIRNAGTSSSSSAFVISNNSTGIGNGASVFVVRQNGDTRNFNNSYGGLSDIKLKENIVDASSQWDDIKALRPVNYNFKEGQTHTQLGLIAQEVELVSPGLVTESPDRDEDGNDLGTTTKSVNYSVLYMKAVKALQEAMERIETLETANASLEARLTALEGGAS